MASKRKPGKRDKSGRRLRPTTRIERIPLSRGNEFVQARAELFEIFRPKGAKEFKPEQHCDGPGQAHLAGLFDNLPADPVALRDAAREYAELYWGYYVALSAKAANLAGSIPGRSNSDAATARERRFLRMDEALGPMTSPARHAVYGLCVDYWGRDEIAPFLAKLINARRVLLGKAVVGYLPTQRDRDTWKAACDGLLLMVAGKGTNERIERSAA